MSDLAYLLDRLALRDLVDRYATTVDRRQPEATAELFVPDGELCIFERGKPDPVRERVGRPAIAAAMKGLERYDVTLHVVGNHTAVIDGDTATGETYCLAHHVRDVEQPDGPAQPYDFVMHIRYLDRYRRTDDGWRIERRELQIELTEDRPVTGP